MILPNWNSNIFEKFESFNLFKSKRIILFYDDYSLLLSQNTDHFFLLFVGGIWTHIPYSMTKTLLFDLIEIHSQ